MNASKILIGLLLVSLLVVGAWYSQARVFPDPTTHIYYIAADEVVWDYAPGEIDQITGEPYDSIAQIFAQSAPFRIGKIYQKALYREYRDSSFSELKSRSAEWEHLGFLGPLVRAEVGDTINIVFRNNTRFPASVHPHGVFYNKDSEGAPYEDATGASDKSDDGVPSGGTHTYVWPVPERAGPADGDPSSILWMYHSHTNEVRDVNSGLLAPMIISARGTTKEDGTPKDVDRELIVAFAEVNENESWYIEDNIREYAGKPDSISVRMGSFGLISVSPGATFNSNFKESMNGFLFGHLPGLTMRVGDRVRWYIMSSTNFEFHAPHWHGNTVVSGRMRTDVAEILPMGMLVADMVPDNPGIWLFHCHVADHLNAGMQAVYSVMGEGESVASAVGR